MKPRYKIMKGTGTHLHDCGRCCFRNVDCHKVNKSVKCHKSGRSDNRDIYFVEIK
ncbi:hypothetical protein CPT_Phriendly_007 [Vibrio phage Phriendly]|nr:hypothetical protein CPT_Phriendly_007 [Vibrio phage Phriendly]